MRCWREWLALILIAGGVFGLIYACDDPPKFVGVSVEAWNLSPMHETHVRVWVEDPDNDWIRLTWHAEAGIVTPTDDYQEVLYKPPAIPGTYWVEVTVRDLWGKTATTKIPIRVVENW